MHATIFSATPIGVAAQLVSVQVDLSLGLMNFYIVGLPDTAIKESRQRITTALHNAGIKLPDRKITVNLAPADLKKEGTLFDLPIALGILQAAQQLTIPAPIIEQTLFLGELALDGSISPVKGVLAIAKDAKKLGRKSLVVPAANAAEAALVHDIQVIAVGHIIELIEHLLGHKPIAPTPATNPTPMRPLSDDFAQVQGQQQAKRALQVAAAGRHNILFIGSPGSGKTMLATRMPSIMPPMSFEEIIATSTVYSITGKPGLGSHIHTVRPFRAPHHTISQAGLIGGGTVPQPGEVSLAHNGILFLDEVTEFKRSTLEVLRQPLESKEVHIARVHHTVTFPANFLLIAALNPCPCGYYGDPHRTCRCKSQEIQQYLAKISGPLLDRIDIQVHVASLRYEELITEQRATSSAQLYTDVEIACATQQKRFGSQHFNAQMTSDEVSRYCHMTPAAQAALEAAFKRLSLSMRGYHKIIKVARTIADLAQSDLIDQRHIIEAIGYRSLDSFVR
ncbi:YifB family Mg chelatase-like AAA ATPase [Candidatus Dependentiae bacterium]|nr:YifB family Mg chelatase-like AAA ATPase [Candidatus Dependentiae bacterium]